MDDKQRKAIDAANPHPATMDSHPYNASAAFVNGAEWMHAHDAEKLRLAEFVMGFISQGYIVIKELEDIARRIIAEGDDDEA